MIKVLKLSWLTLKNIVFSPRALIGIVLTYIYSFLWIFVANPPSFKILTFTSEYFRLLYIIILYFCFKIIREDTKNNVFKTLFTGTFTRVQIAVTKIVTLLFLGVFFAVLGEINNLFVALVHHEKFGILAFLQINHFDFIISIIAITFTMGAFCLLVSAFKFKSKIISIITIIILAFFNFYTALIVTIVDGHHIKIATSLKVFIQTPIYITTDTLMSFKLTNYSYLIWGVIFALLFIAIINKKELC